MKIPCWDNREYGKASLEWNCWAIDESGVADFIAGGWLSALQHLLECRGCRRANGLTLLWVKSEIKKVMNEWKHYIGM
jgi:hypothetical protein